MVYLKKCLKFNETFKKDTENKRIRAIVFGLEDTLYKVETNFKEDVVNNIINYLSKNLNIEPYDVKELRNKLIKKYGIESTAKVFSLRYALDINNFYNNSFLSVNFKRYFKPDNNLKKSIKALPVEKIVSSDNPTIFANTILHELGIRNLFNEVYGEDRVNFRHKPTPYPLLKIGEDIRLQPQNILYIDSIEANLATAKDIGMNTLEISIDTHVSEFVDLRIPTIYDLPLYFTVVEEEIFSW